MNPLTIISVFVDRSFTWERFLAGLREGRLSAHLVLLGLIFGIAVVLWAVVNLFTKEKRR